MARRWVALVATGACLVAAFFDALPAQAAFPGQNGLIAYGFFHGSSLSVDTVEPSGRHKLQLTTTAKDYAPRWSADGTRIVFEQLVKTGGASRDTIWVMNSDGSGQTKLTQGPYDTGPAWSPDGTRIVFSRGIQGAWTLWTMNADGTDQVQITFGAVDDTWADWSPDGTRIAFTRFSDIATAAPDGSNQVLLTPRRSTGVLPRWSPDGTRLCYTSSDRGNEDVWVMNADGSRKVDLTSTDPSQDFSCAWSPDGTKIVFVTDRTGNQDLWTMNSDGTGQNPLTATNGDEGGPDWQAVP